MSKKESLEEKIVNLKMDLNSNLVNWFQPSGQGFRFRNNAKFLNNIIHAYSRMTTKNDKDRYPDPFTMVRMIAAVDKRYLCGFTDEDELSDAFLDYQLPLTGIQELYNSLVDMYRSTRASATIVQFVESRVNTFFAKSLNNALQYVLHIGKFFDQHFTDLVDGVALLGTGYTRPHLSLEPDENEVGSFTLKAEFQYIPVHRVVMSGISSSRNLNEHPYITIVHNPTIGEFKNWFKRMTKTYEDTISRAVTEKQLNDGILQGVDSGYIFDPYEIQDYIFQHNDVVNNFEAYTTHYQSKNFNSISLLETIWYDYDEERWKTTYFFNSVHGIMDKAGTALGELFTLNHNKDFKIPLIPLYTRTAHESNFGLSLVANFLEPAIAQNELMGKLVNTSIDNSYNKIVMTKIGRASLVDIKNKGVENRILRRKDQQFYLDKDLPNGTSINNFIQQIDKVRLDASGVNILDLFSQQYQKAWGKSDLADPRRASSQAYASYLTEMTKSDSTIKSNLERYFADIFEYISQFLFKEMDEEDFKSINKKVGGGFEALSLREGLDRVSSLARIGLRAELTDINNSTVKNVAATVLPLVEARGVEVLSNPIVATVTGLDKITNPPNQVDIINLHLNVDKLRKQTSMTEPDMEASFISPASDLATMEMELRQLVVKAESPMSGEEEDFITAIRLFYKVVNSKITERQQMVQQAQTAGAEQSSPPQAQAMGIPESNSEMFNDLNITQ